MYRYIFGPVPSRRFGRSLGIDLIPMKTCSFNCVFCQIGNTACCTIRRDDYVPVKDVIAELDSWLAGGGTTDVFTLAGSGEPTLHLHFGDVLEVLRDRQAGRTVLLSNGSLFYLPEVRQGAAKAAVVKTSLSAWDQNSLSRVNRPCADLVFERIVDGLRTFRREYAGEMWLEVFALEGVNADEESMRKIAALAESIGPDCIQLNTVARPPAELTAEAVSREKLKELAELFSPRAEVIAGFTGSRAEVKEGTDAEVLAMIERRPCTANDVAAGLGIDLKKTEERLMALVKLRRVMRATVGAEVFYQKAK